MDARSLLRAKKAEARIEHPYASYSARGELRCSICAVPVKQWEAHLLTKQHRTSVAREKASQAQQAAKAAKRSAASAGGGSGAGAGTGQGDGPASKRARTGEAGAGSSSASGAGAGSSGLPAGFFSQGNERTFDVDNDGDEDEEGSESVSANGQSSTKPIIPAKTGDVELDDFFASLAADTPEAVPQSEYSLTGAASNGQGSGIKTKVRGVARYKDLAPGQASYEAAPVRNIIPGEEEEEVEEKENEETEVERRERLAREEREEVMARLEEEERAQEDADSRVVMLKQRMEALKKKRAAKAASAVSGGTGVGKAK